MDYENYWNKNIDHWSKLYLNISHGSESLDAPPWFSKVYQSTIGKIEARLMQKRYELTISFLDRFIKPGVVFSDIGCGTGIFCVEALRRGAVVQAIDISERALEVTQENVKLHCPNGKISFHHLDLQKSPLPKTDVALAMGVTPYVEDISAFLKNILSSSDVLYCQYSDPNQIFNKLRTSLPSLNVRNLVFHSRQTVSEVYLRNFAAIRERQTFATGYIDLVSNLKSTTEQ